MNEKEKKEIENQIEEDREEHERDFSNLSKIEQCPKCGGDLEEGVLNAPRGVNWITSTYSETLLSALHWTMPKLWAWRCKKCQLVIFTYGKKTLVHRARERWRGW